MIRILLVDSHHVVREGLSALVGMQPDMAVAGEAADGETALVHYRDLCPDVVTMDLKLPGMGGWRAIAAIRREFPDAKILVLTALMGDEHIFRALQAGALGYLSKESSSNDLVTAIRNTHTGKRTIPEAVAAVLARRVSREPLTAREVDVLRGVAAGLSNREVGDRLGLTENTVKSYLKSISSKLDAPDRTAAAMIALQRGFIDHG